MRPSFRFMGLRLLVPLLLLHPGATEARGGVPPDLVAAHWTAADGLPVQAVRHVLHGRDGYLWLATYDGLVRFDGHRFTVFDAGNTPALPTDRMLYLYETGAGDLWIHTERGHLVRYRDGVFTRYSPEEHFGGAPVTSYHVEDSGDVWAATTRGLFHFDGEGFRRLASDLLHDEPVSFLRAGDGAFWVGTKRQGAFRFEGQRVTDQVYWPGDAGRWVAALWEGPDGTIWLRGERGVGAWAAGRASRQMTEIGAWVQQMRRMLGVPVQSLRDPSSGDLFLYAPGHPRLYGFLPTAQKLRPQVVTGPAGHDWFLLGSALYRDGSVVFEAEGELSSLTFDHEGNLWVSGAAGLYRLYPAPFTTVRIGSGAAAERANTYGLLASRDGAVWAALLGGGVVRYRPGAPEADRTAHFPHPELALTLHEDPDGSIYVGHFGGLCRIRSGGSSCGEVPGFPAVAVRAITRYEGDLWIGTDVGLYRRARGAAAWQHFTRADGLSGEHVRVFLTDRRGALWMGTQDGGVMRYHAGRFRIFTESDGLSSHIIRSLYQDARGVLWIGTENHGLNRVTLDAATGEPAEVSVVRRRHGLPDDGIHQILEDDQGRLWMSTNHGIFHVPRDLLDAFAEGRIQYVISTAYDEGDGLLSREANGGVHGAGVRARDGRLWFPTQAGPAVVDPAAIERVPPPPFVAIESVHFADSTVTPSGMLRLPVGERRLEVQYTAPAFRNPQAVAFRYRLVGLDDGWVTAGNDRRATYTNLPPGRYRFEVTAATAPGVWSSRAATLELYLPPRFYETRWFAVLLGTGLLGLLAAAYHRRVRQHHRREAELETLVAARTREVEVQKDRLAAQADQLRALDRAKSHFFAALSHEFRTPLTLAMGSLDDLRHGAGEAFGPDARAQIDQALLNNQRLLRLVNQLLDVARAEANGLRLRIQPMALQAFTRSIAGVFAGLAEREQIALQLDLQDAPITVYADPEQFEKVITNLLSNAFKFTPPGGTITLAIRATATAAVLAVEDTGVGIPPDELAHVFDRFYQGTAPTRATQAGTGLGLALTREIVVLHGGRIEAASTVGRGTIFTVHLPLGRAHLGGRAGVEVLETPLAIDAPPLAAGDGFDRAAAPLPPSTAAAADDRTTVLLVDDNAEVRAFVRRHLAVHYHVVEAADGTEALEMARTAPPDLIVSDVMMPRLDGVALVEALRSDPELDFVPVILLTARAEQADKLEGLDAGADDYLVKPFDVRELLARVRNLIAMRHRLQREVRQQAERPSPFSHVEVMSEDEAFEARMREAVETHLSDADFGIDTLAEVLGVSRATLYRRTREAVDATPAEYLRTARLERAQALLRARAGNVSEVAYAVGFRSVPHFITSFRDHTGQTPAAYAAGVS